MNDPLVILASQRTSVPEHRGPHLWPLIILMLIVLAVSVSVFGPRADQGLATPTPSGTPEREARVYSVSYRFGVFSPTNLRIHTGDTVRFRNDSSSAIRITADKLPDEKTPEFDSVGPVEAGSQFSYTFSVAGVFDYYNYDDTSQTGTIIVR